MQGRASRKDGIVRERRRWRTDVAVGRDVKGQGWPLGSAFLSGRTQWVAPSLEWYNALALHRAGRPVEPHLRPAAVAAVPSSTPDGCTAIRALDAPLRNRSTRASACVSRRAQPSRSLSVCLSICPAVSQSVCCLAGCTPRPLTRVTCITASLRRFIQ